MAFIEESDWDSWQKRKREEAAERKRKEDEAATWQAAQRGVGAPISREDVAANLRPALDAGVQMPAPRPQPDVPASDPGALLRQWVESTAKKVMPPTFRPEPEPPQAEKPPIYGPPMPITRLGRAPTTAEAGLEVVGGVGEAYSRGITAPMAEAIARSGEEQPVPEGLARPVSPDLPRIIRSAAAPRRTSADVISSVYGSPEAYWRASQQFYERPEDFPAEKGLLEGIADPLNIPAGGLARGVGLLGKSAKALAAEKAAQVALERSAAKMAAVRGAQRVLAPAAQTASEAAVPSIVSRAATAARDIAQSPTVRAMTPGLGVAEEVPATRISGTPMGIAARTSPEAVSAGLGGIGGALSTDETMTPEEKLSRIMQGMAAGGLGMAGARRGVKGVQGMAGRLAPKLGVEGVGKADDLLLKSQEVRPKTVARQEGMFAPGEVRPQMKGAVVGEQVRQGDLLGERQFADEAARAQFEREQAVKAGQAELPAAVTESAEDRAIVLMNKAADVEQQLMAVEERISDLRVSRQIHNETKGTIVRPRNKFVGWTDEEIEEIARRSTDQQGNPLNPYVADWWDAVDQAAMADFNAYRRGGGKTARLKAEAAEIKRLEAERKELAQEAANLRQEADDAYRAVSAEPELPRAASTADEAAGAVPPRKPPEPPTAQAAMPEPEPEVPPARPGFAGNIRLAKFDEELQPQIKATYDADPAKFEAARRGVRPDEQVRADAVDLINSVGGNGEKSVKQWQAGQAWNAEEILALREVLEGRTQEVVSAQKLVREQGDSTANLLRLRLTLENQKLAQEAVAGVSAEAGRALRQFRQTIAGAIASGDEKKMATLLERLGGRNNAEELAAGLAKIDMNNQEDVFRFVRSSLKPKRSDYITEIFYNSILSGPRTHEVNIIGNTLAALLAPVETAASALVDMPLSAIQRRPREHFLREVKPEVFGMARALPEGVRKALYILRNGYSWDDVAKLEIRRPQAFKGKLGAVINMPSRALSAADAIFRSIHYGAALNGGAYRIARREGLKGDALASRIAELLAKPSDELLTHAGKMEAYRVYQQAPGQVARGLMQIRDVDVAGVSPLRFALPFVQTPANLVKYGLERSPLGFLNPSIWRNLAKKNSEAADQLGRAMVGSSIAAAMAYYAADGKITGPAPESPAERDAFYRLGKQPFSVKMGDRWVPFNRFEPLNQTLAQVATTVEAIRQGKDVRSSVGAIIAGIGKNLVSQTYMSGVADLMNAVEDPERYGTNVGERAIVGTVIPFSAAMRTAAQTIDPTIRRSQGLQEELQATVPGLTQGLTPRLTAFGEEAQRASPPYLPVTVTQEKQDPADLELARLRVNVGLAGDSIRGVQLSRLEQNEYQKVVGPKIKALVDKVVASPIYQQLEDATKAAILERAIRRSRDEGSLAMLQQIGPEEIRARLKARQAVAR